MVGKRKEEIITFKVDEALAHELRHMPNRSQFIRDALLSALKNECPVCHGAGTLSPNQMKHWQEFAEHHRVVACDDCNETYIVCDASESIP